MDYLLQNAEQSTTPQTVSPPSKDQASTTALPLPEGLNFE